MSVGQSGPVNRAHIACESARPEQSGAVLIVSRFDRDLISLLRILNDTEGELYWYAASAGAIACLKRHSIGVIICDHDLTCGSWKDLLEGLPCCVNAPPLIVAARFADERLWAEVLNLGGYDVLRKPFEAPEVERVVALARRSRLLKN